MSSRVAGLLRKVPIAGILACFMVAAAARPERAAGMDFVLEEYLASAGHPGVKLPFQLSAPLPQSTDKSRWQDSKELYSWHTPAGGWEFCLLPNKSSLYTDESVFDPFITIKGVEALKKKLLSLPGSASVNWMSKPPGCSEKIAYPGMEIRLEVSEFAKSHKIPFVISGDNKNVAFAEIVPSVFADAGLPVGLYIRWNGEVTFSTHDSEKHTFSATAPVAEIALALKNVGIKTVKIQLDKNADNAPNRADSQKLGPIKKALENAEIQVSGVSVASGTYSPP